MKQIIRVGIYLRLSNEDKDKQNKTDDSESIKNQRNMLLDYISRHPDLKLIDEYCDEDLSGAGTYRPEFERLIKDCESKKLDIVLCKSQSRFSRDMEIVERYINNKFLEWNIRFIGISDNADTNILGNKKSRQINGLVNEWYLEDVSNNIKSALSSKMKQGEFISPFAAFGYKISPNNNNKLIIDQEAANIVQKIFKLYLNNLGFTKIAKYLNERNIPSPSLYKYKKGCKLNIVSTKPRNQIKWNANAIKTILTNELYIGTLIQGKRTTISYKNHKITNKPQNKWIKKEHTHEPIIDKKTFIKAQNIIKEKIKIRSSKGTIHHFAGKVFCLECNSCMKKKNSSKHEYLVCSNFNENNNCKNNSSIRYDELENIILNEINKKIKKYYDETLLKQNLLKKHENNTINKITFLEKQKKELKIKILDYDNYLENLYEDKIKNVLTNEQFKKLVTKYDYNQTLLKNKIKTIEEQITYYKIKEKEKSNEKLYKYKKLNNLDRIIIQEFINKIYIGKVDKETKIRIIKITWNFE